MPQRPTRKEREQLRQPSDLAPRPGDLDVGREQSLRYVSVAGGDLCDPSLTCHERRLPIPGDAFGVGDLDEIEQTVVREPLESRSTETTTRGIGRVGASTRPQVADAPRRLEEARTRRHPSVEPETDQLPRAGVDLLADDDLARDKRRDLARRDDRVVVGDGDDVIGPDAGRELLRSRRRVPRGVGVDMEIEAHLAARERHGSDQQARRARPARQFDLVVTDASEIEQHALEVA